MNLVSEPESTEPLALGPVLRRIGSRIRDRYPEAAIDLDETEAAVVATPSLEGALEDVIENGIVHGEQDTPTVRIGVQSEPEAVTVTVTDDGPGLPEMERHVLTAQDKSRHSITEAGPGCGRSIWSSAGQTDR
jgi:K+-sensing histidine kinase KdpD